MLISRVIRAASAAAVVLFVLLLGTADNMASLDNLGERVFQARIEYRHNVTQRQSLERVTADPARSQTVLALEIVEKPEPFTLPEADVAFDDELKLSLLE